MSSDSNRNAPCESGYSLAFTQDFGSLPVLRKLADMERPRKNVNGGAGSRLIGWDWMALQAGSCACEPGFQHPPTGSLGQKQLVCPIRHAPWPCGVDL